jgi:hypothetical protein
MKIKLFVYATLLTGGLVIAQGSFNLARTSIDAKNPTYYIDEELRRPPAQYKSVQWEDDGTGRSAILHWFCY